MAGYIDYYPHYHTQFPFTIVYHASREDMGNEIHSVVLKWVMVIDEV